MTTMSSSLQKHAAYQKHSFAEQMKKDSQDGTAYTQLSRKTAIRTQVLLALVFCTVWTHQ